MIRRRLAIHHKIALQSKDGTIEWRADIRSGERVIAEKESVVLSLQRAVSYQGREGMGEDSRSCIARTRSPAQVERTRPR